MDRGHLEVTRAIRISLGVNWGHVVVMVLLRWLGYELLDEDSECDLENPHFKAAHPLLQNSQ